MATGRTISASFLTEFDKQVIKLCDEISGAICDSISDIKKKKEFKKEYGAISYTRDAGMGRGGGKLQRDAICTRGRQGKAPYSNRNLRWHPLIVAQEAPNFAKEIERIEIEGEGESQLLIFVVKDLNKSEIRYPADKVYEMKERYVALPKHWISHVDKLKHWNDNLWTQNSCVISALEACNWEDSVETYAILGISLAVELYEADFNELYKKIELILQNQDIDKNVILPSLIFPKEKENIVKCPVCLLNISKNLEQFRKSSRLSTWQPAWNHSKREEGDDSSLQIMHVNPLLENKIRHNVSNVRYGHRWCNVAMTDHSLVETVDFMEFIVKAHNRCK
jgi:hypothetical protein